VKVPERALLRCASCRHLLRPCVAAVCKADQETRGEDGGGCARVADGYSSRQRVGECKDGVVRRRRVRRGEVKPVRSRVGEKPCLLGLREGGKVDPRRGNGLSTPETCEVVRPVWRRRRLFCSQKRTRRLQTNEVGCDDGKRTTGLVWIRLGSVRMGQIRSGQVLLPQTNV